MFRSKLDVINDLIDFYQEGKINGCYNVEQIEIMKSHRGMFSNIMWSDVINADGPRRLDTFLDEVAMEVMGNNYYIAWNDGVNSGFVDYCDDFVCDEIFDRARFFKTEKEAIEYKEDIQKRFPLAKIEVVSLTSFL